MAGALDHFDFFLDLGRDLGSHVSTFAARGFDLVDSFLVTLLLFEHFAAFFTVDGSDEHYC